MSETPQSIIDEATKRAAPSPPAAWAYIIRRGLSLRWGGQESRPGSRPLSEYR